MKEELQMIEEPQLRGIDPIFITPKLAGELTHISECTIREMCQANELPCVRVGKNWKISYELLKEWAKAKCGR
ncbi:MAG: excisionase family DNA-binding protein [Eubacteriaceae bacterium]|nr:excisionase family DNA-binding protein [Eubacteriaceae bacterium]